MLVGIVIFGAYILIKYLDKLEDVREYRHQELMGTLKSTKNYSRND